LHSGIDLCHYPTSLSIGLALALSGACVKKLNKRLLSLLLLSVVFPVAAAAQSDVRQLQPLLSAPIQSSEVTEFQLRQYLMKRVTHVRLPKDAKEWTAEARRIRAHLLDDVMFHGWPKEWVSAQPRFETVGTIETGNGYRIIKLRYEIVPGFFSSALLYEPQTLTARMPAILNVNGHVGPVGKAVEYKQKRCINFAKRGILALNLEWIGYGELSGQENKHSYAAHLDLAGSNGVGLFYLAMRKGLDYLYGHANVDRTRIGVTGLSGGGWQTITLSALDERVTVAVPVAGYSSLMTGIEHPEYVGNDIEQNATDFRDGQDYAHLTAMRAPRPTLLIYNAEDDCCFRAPLVKEGVFDAIKPFFRLLGKEDVFRWHENTDPGTHNYHLDNRMQSYQFFAKHFGLPAIDAEIPVPGDIKTASELEVGLPKDNLTILGLARKLALNTVPASHDAPGTSHAAQRTNLSKLIRFGPVTVQHAWPVGSTKNKGVESRSYVFELSNGLCATGVWAKAVNTPDNASAMIVLNDGGKKSTAEVVSDSVNRGEQVLALDLLFTGDNSVTDRRVPEYTQLLATVGDRPIGIKAAQLLAITSWMERTMSVRTKRILSTGIRSQTVSLIAAALNPAAYAEVSIRDGMRSFRWLLDTPVPYESAPDLFCLDLYKDFDVPRLVALAAPTNIRQTFLEHGEPRPKATAAAQ
jgi:dienelactone hydrolase